jgi:hypothetical protein
VKDGVMQRREDSWAAFGWWCLAGAGLALGVLTILGVGPFVLLVALVLCGWLLWRVELGWAMLGLLSGAGVPLAFVGWFADTRWSPWLYVVVAGLIVAVGVVAFLGYRRT